MLPTRLPRRWSGAYGAACFRGAGRPVVGTPTLPAAMAELVDTDVVQTPKFALDSVGADTVTTRVEPALPMHGQPPTAAAQPPSIAAATTHAEPVVLFNLDRYDRKLRHLSDVTDDGATKAPIAVTTLGIPSSPISVSASGPSSIVPAAVAS